MAAPKIDDQYWFDWSKGYIDEAFSRRNDAADKLQKVVVWLWGVYTAGAAVGFALSTKKLDVLPTVLIGLGSVLLILVYWATAWVQMPLTVEFDPRSPTEIADAHYAAVKKKGTRLRVTLALSLLAAISVAGALLMASLWPAKEESKEYEPALTLHVEPAADKVLIAVSLGLKPKTPVTVTVKVIDGDKRTDVAQHAYITKEDGTLQASISTTVVAKHYEVTMQWKEDRAVRTLTLTRSVPEP